MRKLLLGSLILGALVSPALAADLPVKAPAPVPVATWDGWYLGASVGWEWATSNWTTTCFQDLPDGNPPCGPNNRFIVDRSSPHSFDTSGARVGGYFGVNWQVAPTWVVGVEADFGLHDKTSTVVGIVGCTIGCVPGLTGRTPANDSTSVRTIWDASIRARLGYLVTPNALLYGTGGLAQEAMDANVTCNVATSPWCSFNENQTFASHILTGWTIGGGLEWKAATNWILRGEYRYSQFGTFSPVFFGSTTDEIHADITTPHTHMVTFGISYLFGGTGPVVARY
jgi:outer membrane immunogenic protein